MCIVLGARIGLAHRGWHAARALLCFVGNFVEQESIYVSISAYSGWEIRAKVPLKYRKVNFNSRFEMDEPPAQGKLQMGVGVEESRNDVIKG
jgi:hypothetical protein